eukprot:514214-Hanusia_phi.AAC.1
MRTLSASSESRIEGSTTKREDGEEAWGGEEHADMRLGIKEAEEDTRRCRTATQGRCSGAGSMEAV